MAEGRMLKKRISQSHKFAALKSNSARLLYLMIIPHLDIKGRLEADPKIIKGLIVPLLNFSQRKIWEYEEDMHRVGLIKLYSSNEQWYLEVTKFGDFQSLRDSHEAKSQCPDPATGELRELDGTTTAKVNISKVKESKGKYTKEFELFWTKFKGRWSADKGYVKVGKYAASEEWEKLTLEEQRKAWQNADKGSCEFKPDACRWLKNKMFDDF